jgi:hypothetical protein
VPVAMHPVHSDTVPKRVRGIPAGRTVKRRRPRPAVSGRDVDRRPGRAVRRHLQP